MSISLVLQCMFGMECKDFTIIAADQMNTQSVLVMKNVETMEYKVHLVLTPRLIASLGDKRAGSFFAQRISLAIQYGNAASILGTIPHVDKVFEISDKLMLGVNGEPGDMAQFTQFIAKNLELYKRRNRYELNTAAVAHFTRKCLSGGSGVGSPYILNALIGGYDESGSHLYTVDFLGSCLRVPYAAHGLGGLLGFSILDYYYKLDLSEMEAYNILKLCVREVQQRLFMNLPNFKVKSVSKFGIKTLPCIKSEMLIQE